ncbi:MAG: response regulator [Anaeromyxobacteraceae bacterium]
MSDPTVMVVEDDTSVRELVVQVLAGEGFTAVGARNGAEALQRLRQDHLQPALILLDLVMPVMDGWHFRLEQLLDPALAGIPVVVISASDDGGVPAADRVHKPFDMEELLHVVSRFAAPT